MGNDLQYGIAKDDSLRMERSLRDSELSYRRLFEAARDGILILNVETGRIDDVNPFLVELLGFSRAEIIGKTVGELSPFKDILSNQAMLKRLQMDRHIRYEDLPLETKDGRKIAVEFVSNVYQSGDKEVIQCNVRDITERRAAEQHLHLLNTCVSHLNEIILVTEAEPLDEPGPKIVYVNEAFERLTGYTAAEAVGRSPRFLQGEKTDRKVLAEIHAALQRREPIKRQVVNYRKDGTEYWMEVNVVPIFDAAGKCTHFAAIERDITEAKKVEAQLLWKTAFFEAQVNSALDAVIVVDSEGKKVLENPQMFALWNHPNEILEEVDHRRRLEWIASLIKNPRQFAEKVAHLYAHPDEVSRDVLELNDGRYLDRYTAPVRGLDGKYFGRIWTYRDITERKRADEGVRRLAAIVESSADAIISKTPLNHLASCKGSPPTLISFVALASGVNTPLMILIGIKKLPSSSHRLDSLCPRQRPVRPVCFGSKHEPPGRATPATRPARSPSERKSRIFQPPGAREESFAPVLRAGFAGLNFAPGKGRFLQMVPASNPTVLAIRQILRQARAGFCKWCRRPIRQFWRSDKVS
jgi:PAS domain S-box-containing protein